MNFVRYAPAAWITKEGLMLRQSVGLYFLLSLLVDWIQSTYFLKDYLLYLKLVSIFIHSLFLKSTSTTASELVFDQTSGYYNTSLWTPGCYNMLAEENITMLDCNLV